MADIPISPGDLLYDFKVSGEIEVTRGFEEHLEISGVKVSVSYADNLTVRNLLKKGSYHTVLGYRCRVHDWQITDHTDRQVLTYELTLKHENAPMDSDIPSIRHALDTPVKVKANCDSSNCLVLSNIIAYDGLQGYRIPFDNPDGELEVTPRLLLEQYKRRLHPSDAAFIDWDNLTFKEWGKTPTYTIRAISEEIKISEPGQGADIGGIQLTDEAYGLEWVADKDSEEKSDIYEVNVVEPVREFYGGADTISRDEYDLESFKSSGCWFDSGGLTKERVTTWLCNSKPYKRRVEKWGFIGSSIGAVSKPNSPSLGMYDFLRTHDYERKVTTDKEGNEIIEYIIKARNIDHQQAFSCWQKFYDVTEHIEWNRITQYRGDSQKTGWILYRPKSESQLDALNTLIEDEKMNDELEKLNKELLEILGSEDLEAIKEKKEEIAVKKAEVKKNKQKNEAKRRLYAGFRVVHLDPLKNYTRYKLGSLANRYYDIHATAESPYLYCEELEESVDWFASFLDPDADENIPLEQQPKISVGERYHKKVRTDILLPYSRADTSGIEVYRVTETQLNNQGYNFRDRIEISPETYMKGRPPEHERREFYGRVGAVITSTGSTSIGVPRPKQSDPVNVTNILSTPGSGFDINTESPKGTWSSPGVTNFAQAKKAFELEYSIENTKNARVASFETDANPNILPGDIINWNNQKWVLLNTKTTWTIEEGNAHADKMTVDIGYLVLFGSLWQHYNPTANPAEAPSAVVHTRSYLVDADSVSRGEPIGSNVGSQFRSVLDNLGTTNIQFDEIIYQSIVSIEDELSTADGKFNNTKAYLTDTLQSSNTKTNALEFDVVDSCDDEIIESSDLSYKSISFAGNKKIGSAQDRFFTSVVTFSSKLDDRIKSAEDTINTVQATKFRTPVLGKTGLVDTLESLKSNYRTLDYSEVKTIEDNLLSSTSGHKISTIDKIETIYDNLLSSTSGHKISTIDKIETIYDNLLSSTSGHKLIIFAEVETISDNLLGDNGKYIMP